MQTNQVTWLDKFRAAFDSFAPNLGVVLNAVGCREGWVQGELYRYFSAQDPDFRVNSYSLATRKKADLYGRNPVPMVAEIKVFGVQGYYHKNLAGCSNIDCYLPTESGSRVEVTSDHLTNVSESEDSLLRDYLRLRNHTSEYEELEKYLILILRTDGEPDRFGRVIQAVRLSDRETTLNYPQAMVRIWAIPD